MELRGTAKPSQRAAEDRSHSQRKARRGGRRRSGEASASHKLDRWWRDRWPN